MSTCLSRTALILLLAAGSTSLAIASAPKEAETVDGRWNASLIHNGQEIPFRLDISGSGPTLKGTLYNGFVPYDGTTSATFEEGRLVLNIEHYLTVIDATLKDGTLSGTVSVRSRGASADYGFRASRYASPVVSAADVPSISGSWEIPLETASSKGEHAFRFIVEQRGAEVAASILRVDGDTGAYSGTYADGKWILSHFDGSRPGVIVVTPTPQGTLEILQSPERPDAAVTRAGGSGAGAGGKAYEDSIADGRYAPKLIAYRSEVARARAAGARELRDAHDRARSERAIHVQLPRCRGQAGLERGRALQGQGHSRHRHGHVVPELP